MEEFGCPTMVDPILLTINCNTLGRLRFTGEDTSHIQQSVVPLPSSMTRHAATRETPALIAIGVYVLNAKNHNTRY
jgi:hypothetical protein